MLAASLLVLLLPSGAGASLARAVTLPQLVARSEQVVIGTPLEAHARWETLGGQRRIVTYTRVRVDAAIDGGGQSELFIRTLGGHVGDIGQVVSGEAVLSIGQPALVFVGRSADGVLAVSAMAQGHFPLRRDGHGTLRLRPSPRLATLVGAQHSAVKRLVGHSIPEAEQLIAGARSHAP
jgi:hypothetical protein